MIINKLGRYALRNPDLGEAVVDHLGVDTIFGYIYQHIHHVPVLPMAWGFDGKVHIVDHITNGKDLVKYLGPKEDE